MIKVLSILVALASSVACAEYSNPTTPARLCFVSAKLTLQCNGPQPAADIPLTNLSETIQNGYRIVNTQQTDTGTIWTFIAKQ